MNAQKRLIRRRIISWTSRTLIFVGLVILLGQRINYLAIGIPGSGWLVVGTFLFAVGMMALAAQMEAAVDRSEERRREADWAEQERERPLD